MEASDCSFLIILTPAVRRNLVIRSLLVVHTCRGRSFALWQLLIGLLCRQIQPARLLLERTTDQHQMMTTVLSPLQSINTTPLQQQRHPAHHLLHEWKGVWPPLWHWGLVLLLQSPERTDVTNRKSGHSALEISLCNWRICPAACWRPALLLWRCRGSSYWLKRIQQKQGIKQQIKPKMTFNKHMESVNFMSLDPNWASNFGKQVVLKGLLLKRQSSDCLLMWQHPRRTSTHFF